MQLKEFYDYKNQLMKDILTKEKIISLISEDTTIDNAKKLAYTQVYPCDYVQDTIVDGKTYICFDSDIIGVDSKTYYTSYLYIWVFVHASNLRSPHGGVRCDEICEEICNYINGSRYYGLGELNLTSVKRYAPMTDYMGKLMTFVAKDFNRLHNGSKPVPTNRKKP